LHSAFSKAGVLGVDPKFVQELLGHADISLTLNVYSHVFDMGDAAAGAMDDALA
jgi:integrase